MAVICSVKRVHGVGVFRRFKILVHNGTQVQTAGQEGTAGKTAAPHVLLVNKRSIASEDLLGIDVRPTLGIQVEVRILNEITIPARTRNVIFVARVSGVDRIVRRFGHIGCKNEANEER